MMKIAFTHNLKLMDREEEAEFDTPETVEAITQSLIRAGFEVEPVEVSGPASRTVARLEALAPDLIFNTAEGLHGRFREAFYPALFDQLGIPHTGSDAYACTLTLDKHLSKLHLNQFGILTPKWMYVESLEAIRGIDLQFPVMVKPNFEGSSKGITQDSVVERPEELEAKVEELLKRYPSGLLIEEFIHGKDVIVPFIEGTAAPGGILTPGEYEFDSERIGNRKYAIYDYSLKHQYSDAVNVRVPALLDAQTAAELQKISARVYRALRIRDVGRIDYRITPDGKIYFIEINALPSLEPGAGIYLSAAQAGLTRTDEVLSAIIRSAAKRHGLEGLLSRKSRRSRSGQLRVGLTYNLKRVVAKTEGDDDRDAEYDSPSTIRALRQAIESYGHQVIELEATSELASILPASQLDVVFNIAEGIKGRTRESQVPALLELVDIPYTGSDPACLALSLDKGLAKRIVRQAGVPTPEYFTITTGKEKIPKTLRYPLIVKPVAEGSSKGVVGSSVVNTEEELRRAAFEMVNRYRQPALVEEYLPGREFTVALLGERRPKVLPPMEIVFLDANVKQPIYAFKHKLDATSEIRYDAPARLDPPLLKEIERVAKTCFTALGCRDVARVDLRLDGDGRVNFIECNPLPGLTPDWSDLCLIAKSAGMEYRILVGEILAPAIKRLKQRDRAKKLAQPTQAPLAIGGADA